MNPIYLLLSIFVLLPLCICLYISLKDMYEAYKHNKENPDKLPIVYTYGDIIFTLGACIVPGFNIVFVFLLFKDKLEKLFFFWEKRAI
jgi:hypothetical protein